MLVNPLPTFDGNSLFNILNRWMCATTKDNKVPCSTILCNRLNENGGRMRRETIRRDVFIIIRISIHARLVLAILIRIGRVGRLPTKCRLLQSLFEFITNEVCKTDNVKHDCSLACLILSSAESSPFPSHPEHQSLCMPHHQCTESDQHSHEVCLRSDRRLYTYD